MTGRAFFVSYQTIWKLLVLLETLSISGMTLAQKARTSVHKRRNCRAVAGTWALVGDAPIAGIVSDARAETATSGLEETFTAPLVCKIERANKGARGGYRRKCSQSEVRSDAAGVLPGPPLMEALLTLALTLVQEQSIV